MHPPPSPDPAIAPGVYRHYKGKLYRVLAEVRHSESSEPMVLYQALYAGRGLWVRPRAMFAGTVLVDGLAQPRFARVAEPDAAHADEAPCTGDELLAVITTVDSEALARNMAAQLLEKHLAACVQIAPIESHYRWDGALQCTQEWRLRCKTTAARGAALQQAIAAMHSYETPAIYNEPLHQVHAPFAQWVRGEVGPG